MIPPITSILPLSIVGLSVFCHTCAAFYFNSVDSDDKEILKQPWGPTIGVKQAIVNPVLMEVNGGGNTQVDTVSEPETGGIEDFFHPKPNITHLPEMKCAGVRDERYRCCRVYDDMVEAWWCPESRPFCCQQETACAVCCTVDEMRDQESRRLLGAGDCRQRSSVVHPQPPSPPVDDESWFWNGMKAAWLTMVGVLLASLCCTCVAHKCITYLVSVINDDSEDLEEEYLAYHFDNMTLVGGEDHPTGQPTANRSQLPPKYSDINFMPVQPEVAASRQTPAEPPPVYTSDVEPETADPGPPPRPAPPNEV
ncbi:uncharacterized protein LOC119110377 [Pollicipes pollicipes]|uniref:uncharacterized protein LOC119110377 n=1 Tax=Pollicipes pollicipes TaxID=41117 RepID=UPI0018852B2A|nr:uncharacterized protein LOC119110377 [Pollicipes pollicipes]